MRENDQNIDPSTRASRDQLSLPILGTPAGRIGVSGRGRHPGHQVYQKRRAGDRHTGPDQSPQSVSRICTFFSSVAIKKIVKYLFKKNRGMKIVIGTIPVYLVQKEAKCNLIYNL